MFMRLIYCHYLLILMMLLVSNYGILVQANVHREERNIVDLYVILLRFSR